MKDLLESRLTGEQRQTLRGLDTPRKIQDYLDATPYSPEYANRSPLQVMNDRLAHCLDGGLFAAAALRRIGYPPLLLDMFPEPGTDDDHVLAIFRQNGRFGAVAKSNFVGLRYREPVYRGLRELVMSYFEQFFNVHGLKTLRTYTRPLNLARFDPLGWEFTTRGADAIEKALLARKRLPLLTPAMAAALSPADELTYKAGLMVANWDGLYKPQA